MMTGVSRFSVPGMMAALLVAGGSMVVQPAMADENRSLPPFAAGTFIGIGADATEGRNIPAGFSALQSGDIVPAGKFSLTYDPVTAYYTIFHSADPAVTGVTLGPSNITATTGSTVTYSNRPPFSISDPAVGSKYTVLTLLRNVPGNTAINLSYTSYAIGSAFTKIDQSGGGQYNPFGGVIGQTTSAAALPRTGAAYYTGVIDGYLGDFRIGGTGDLLANFYTSEIATGLNIAFSGTPIRVDGRGSIAAGTSQFAGDLIGSGNGYLGRFSGSLFGPAYEEAGYSFFLTQSSTVVAGVFVGNQTSLPVTGGSGGITPPAASTGANTSLVGPLVSDRFATSATVLLQNPSRSQLSTGTSGAAIDITKQLDFGAVTIAYNAATSTYTLSDGARTSNFTPANQAPGSAINDNYALKNGTNTLVFEAEKLALLKAGAANSYLPLTYLSYGLWSSETPLGATSNYRSFVYGVETPGANLPRTGAALYDGAVDGYRTDNGTMYRLQGSSGSILANFYTGEVRTTMSLAGINPPSTVSPATLRVDGLGQIADGTSRFAGTLATADASYSGTFEGGFYGPAYQEAGLSFALGGPNSTSSISGALVAKASPGR